MIDPGTRVVALNRFGKPWRWYYVDRMIDPGTRVVALNRLDKPWRWYYVDLDDRCRLVRNPITLVALALGWRPRASVPRAIARRGSS